MQTKPRADLLLTNASEILTCVASPYDIIGRASNGAIAVAGEKILALGAASQVAEQVDTTSTRVINCSGKIIAPGFVDCHTHLVFGGSRVREYAARLTRDLAQVQALGIPTGILATVEMTRAESVDSLAASASQRLRAMLAHGTTTVESKSGYGLTLRDEIKMLEVNRRLQAEQPVDIVSTFLGAHAFPLEMPHEKYLDLVINEMIPRVAQNHLAQFCDVFCDEGYFSVTDASRILQAGRDAGLASKIHTDQYSAKSASALAAEIRATSADHLNYSDRAAMDKLARAGVVGVLSPVLDFAVQHPKAPNARAMLDAGMTLALATDLCPACWVESMQLVMQFACRTYRLSAEEALLASTIGGARALGLGDRGTLAPGKIADLQIWDVPTFEDVIYRLGNNAVTMVIKRGKIVQP